MLLALLALAAVACAAESEVRSESKHFIITYDAETSFEYVVLVLSGLESAYDLFITRSGFATFAEAVPAWIRDDGEDSMGSEYLDMGDDGSLFPVIEIAREATMRAAADATSTGLSLEQAVLSTTAHEFFHVVQDFASLHGDGDVPEPAFVEPLATAAQEIAAPEANDYINSAADFLLAPDSVSFFDRGYDAGIFWVFLLDRFGGLGVLRRVMDASADAEGPAAIDRAFASQGLTFLDLWVKFVIALATGTLPDANAIAKLRASWSLELGLPALDFPPALAVVDWIGSPESADRVTEASVAEALLGYSDSAVGEPLRVTHPYGVDAVAIRPRSSTPLALSIDASPAADMRTVVTGRRDGAWSLISGSGRNIVISDPEHYDELRVLLTRGETGEGTYSVRLAPAP